MMEHAIWGSCDVPLQYQYEPLMAGNAVRILNLKPANDFLSPLRGFITQEQPEFGSIPDGCEYSAVSYTWGDPTPHHELLIGLDTQWTSLPITKSADLLLRYLRDANKTTSLWIDSVCLNQRDQAEKDQQIPLMGQIYAHAGNVHIWLGDDGIEHAQRAFSLMRRIELEGRGRLRPERDDFLCLERFFNRSWFTRRWVIQEIFFARNALFHCGHDTLSLSSVMAVLAKANGLGWSQLPGWGSQMLNSSLCIGKTRRQRLLSLLWDLHDSECTDKRDRIAAIYSLSDVHERPPLHYDIGDWSQMYTNIAAWYINKDAEEAHAILLHLCDFGSIRSSTNVKVPSWIPNWSKRREELVPFQVLESSVEYPIIDSRIGPLGGCIEITSPWGISDKKRWKRELAQSQWRKPLIPSSKPTPMQLEVLGHKLRISYDFLTFIYGCGVVDQVVCPGLSAEFWQEVVELVKWQEKRLDTIKDCFRGNSVVHQAKKRHQMEVDSLSSLLVSVLAGKYSILASALPDLRKSVKRLCACLFPGRARGNNPQALNVNQKELIRKIRSALKDMAILRVQATMGYYWAIGRPNLVKGDWFIPIIAQGEKIPRSPEPRITRFMSLRKIRPGEPEDSWYPSLGSDPEGRLHSLLGFMRAEVDCVHITAKYAGSGGSCLHSFDYNVKRDTVMWRVLRQATDAANKRGLPGPIVFDIV